jgi:hypothetical protein
MSQDKENQEGWLETTRRSFLKRLVGVAATLVGVTVGIVPELRETYPVLAKGQSGDIQWHQLSADELKQYTQIALESSQGKVLENYLMQQGFTRDNSASNGVYVIYYGHVGYIINVAHTNTDGSQAHISHGVGGVDGNQDEMGLGILQPRPEIKDSYYLYEYQVVNGSVELIQTVLLRQQTVQITDHRTGRIHNQKIPALPGQAFCNDCELAFDFLYGLGCTVTSFFTCLTCAVAPPGADVVCGILCALFWYIICFVGDNLNRCTFCEMANLCTSC